MTDTTRDLIQRLANALHVAAEDVGFWGSYAFSYFQEKHDLPGNIAKIHVQAEEARAFLAQPEPEQPSDEELLDMNNTDAEDAARYRWIKAQKKLEIRTNITYGAPWTKINTGEKYYPSHQLNVNGTGFNGIEHFDDLINQAMNMYPLKAQ